MNTMPQPGDRIRLLEMRDDPNPVPTGEIGTVVGVFSHGTGKDTWHQVEVAWDNGRSLMLTLPPDCFEILPEVPMAVDTKIDNSTNGDATAQTRLQTALQKINDQFGEDLRKLAE